jgi:hypothetical protein
MIRPAYLGLTTQSYIYSNSLGGLHLVVVIHDSAQGFPYVNFPAPIIDSGARGNFQDPWSDVLHWTSSALDTKIVPSPERQLQASVLL